MDRKDIETQVTEVSRSLDIWCADVTDEMHAEGEGCGCGDIRDEE